MQEWETLLTEPAGLGDDPRVWEAWFAVVAGRLLNGTRFLVADEPHRFTEIEFYYYGGAHKDPFTHREPLQRETGRWYFHRTQGVYRGGSFKGVDLTFGGPDAFGGILIRGIETPDGTLVDGPSLTVDHLLRRTEAADVATLDAAIDGRQAWDPDNPLRLEWTDLGERQLLHTARVGLSLKRLRQSPDPPRYVLRAYRFLSEPRRISKGKLHAVLALHAAGADEDAIHKRTGCPRGTVKRYVEDFEAGRLQPDFTPFFGADLGPAELCRMHGVWHEQFGRKADSSPP